jgi:hypothetical protein
LTPGAPGDRLPEVFRDKGDGNQEAGASPARSRHCDRGANPNQQPLRRRSRAGRPGKRRAGSQETGRQPERPTGARTPKEVLVEKDSLDRRISLAEMPLWSWALTLLLLAMLFVLLSASGGLLVPLLGQAAGVFDYMHEFAHDGRHLLAVPCH